MLEQFHFLEPLWLLALLPLIIVFWLAFQTKTDSRAWEKIIDADLLPLLLQGKDSNSNKLSKFLLAIGWIVAAFALADPVWEKVPRPIFQTNAARVIVLDLSNSMLIDDLKPSRLARARFKIEDILSREEEGQTGLVLFAGEAFTASPLTRDTETIRSLLKVLTPQIMPAQGSRADLGLIKAHELLKQAGIINGHVLLIADGVSQKSSSLNAAENLRKDGHKVSVMAVGTEAGGKLNFRNNTSVSVKLEAKSLNNIAKSGGGNYHLMTTNNTDLKHLLTSISDNSSLEEKQNTQNGNDDDQEIQNREWHSTGPLLVLILLPFAALVFRRGWLLNLAVVSLVFGLVSQPQEIMAAESDKLSQSQELQQSQQSKWQVLVEQLSKNKAQRANQALLNQQYEKARDLSDDPLGRGSAEYKLKNYEEALKSFKQAEGADARYNEANTLAKLKKYEEAITIYDEALKLNSSMQDALDNKKSIEDFLKRQQQSGKESQSSNENQEGSSGAENEQQNSQKSDSQNKQDEKNGSKSANKGGDQEQQNEKDAKDNQFSDANKDLDKNRNDAEKEELQAAKNQAEQDKKNEEEKGQTDSKDQKLSNEGEDDATTDVTKKEVKELADELSQEEKMAAEQWLRRIPDDPGGLLRRKFRHQYNQNRRSSNSNSTEQPW